MKTNITIDQFNELTDDEKKALQDIWKPEDGDLYYKRTTVKTPDTKYETYEDIDVIHDACAGEFGEGKNILKKTIVDKENVTLIRSEAFPLPSVANLIDWLGKPLIIKWNSEFHGARVDVTFVSKFPEKLTLAAINESLRQESAEELCDALWRAFLVRLRS